jgi:prefoldin subunit 5
MDKATTPSKSDEDTAAYAAKIEETRKKAVALEMSIEKIKTAIKDLDEVEDLDDVDIGALMGVGTAD